MAAIFPKLASSALLHIALYIGSIVIFLVVQLMLDQKNGEENWKERKKVEQKLIQPKSKKILPSDDHSIHWVVPKLAWNCTLVVASLISDAAKLLFSAPPNTHTHTQRVLKLFYSEDESSGLLDCLHNLALLLLHIK